MVLTGSLFTFSNTTTHASAMKTTFAMPHITKEQFVFIEDSLSMNEPSILEWLVGVKRIVNTETMLNPSSLFAKTLFQKGNLTDHDRHLLSYRVEIRELENVPNTYVALFYSRLHMNKTLIRSSLFQDGGPDVEAGTLTKGEHLFYHESLEAARGLNIRSTTLDRVNQLTQQSRYLTLSNPESPFYEEQRFLEQMLPILRAKNNGEDFFLIAANVVGFSLDTLTHEIAHALFDSNKEYQYFIRKFWNNTVTSADKEAIREILGGIYTSEDVFIDEFQAYLLQAEVPIGQSDLLALFRPKYKARLQKALERNNLTLPYKSTDLKQKNSSTKTCKPLIPSQS